MGHSMGISGAKLTALSPFKYIKLTQKLEILNLIRDQRTKKLETKEQLKSCETKECVY